MTQEVAQMLAKSLIPMFDAGIITVLSGLVKTATVLSPEGKTIRFPIPYQSDDDALQIRNSALVPDSRQRCIVYFEEVDTDVTKSRENYTRFRSRLRLVCWFDVSKFQTTPSNVQVALTARMTVDVRNTRSAEGSPLLALKVVPGKLLNNVPALFSKYTYKEEKTQYLQAPYYAFGIDFTADYQINHDCKNDEILLPVQSIRPD